MNTNEAAPEGGKDSNVRDQMQTIARLIDEQLPQGWGFALLTFPFGGAPGRTNYIANGDRAGVVAEMKALMEAGIQEGYSRERDERKNKT